MKTYRIQPDVLKAFAVEIKSATSMDNIRRAFSKQPDGSANFYAETDAEIQVCQKYGKLNDQYHNFGK